MAAVARGHGGDCGGDPPSGNWQPPSGSCGGDGGKKGRGPARNVDLRRIWKKNGQRPLPIEFDTVRMNPTWRPVGPNGDYFTSLVGNLVKGIPYRYASWDQVPSENKMSIFPWIETYFDMVPHYQGPHSAQIRSGIDSLCAERYRDQKYRFKEKWFTQRRKVMEVEELRQNPPPNMEPGEWSLHVDFFCEDKVVRRSEANTGVRAQQVHQSLHGRKAYAQYRYDDRDPVTLEPASVIDQYARHHSRNGVFTDEDLAENHRRMVFMRDAQVGSSQPLTEHEIMREVLGERRGHARGIGRQIGSSSSSASRSSAQSHPTTRMYTQAEVDAMMASHEARIEERIEERFRARDSTTQAIYQALVRAGISVELPSQRPDEEPSDDDSDN